MINLIEDNKYLDMLNLFLGKNTKYSVIVYPVHEYWIDIGKPEHLIKLYSNGEKQF